ncbi:hypothetical protein P5673_022098 [Acropora cervicornis]|uniref:Uncharacterized protein n=1 Tax=Acropora cervicornis TaxID=6130 RepID=A0AAD9UZZ9_ACRCE|nr:hypothetical protein P5673_022098 [Acropora cervicornis]
MAEGNLSKGREKFVLFKTIRNARRHRKSIQQSILNTVIAGRRLLLQVPLIILLVVSFNESQKQDRAGVFKATLVGGTQVGTPIVENDLKKLYVFQGEPSFQFILNRIRYDLKRQVVSEDPGLPPLGYEVGHFSPSSLMRGL